MQNNLKSKSAAVGASTNFLELVCQEIGSSFRLFSVFYWVIISHFRLYIRTY